MNANIAEKVMAILDLSDNEFDNLHDSTIDHLHRLIQASEAVLDCDSPSQDMGGDWGSPEWERTVGHAINLARTALISDTGTHVLDS